MEAIGDIMPDFNLDDKFIKLFYSITNTDIPRETTLTDLKQQLASISDLVKTLKDNASKHTDEKVIKAENSEEEFSDKPAILVVDDLGVITYQLKVLLSQFDYDIDCSQEIYDAVNKFKKRKYQYVVMDLFIPTEREGFILLTELKKMALSYGINTVVGVITASPRKEIEQQCRSRGADFFLEKNNDWQNSLYNIMEDYIKDDKKDEENY